MTENIFHIDQIIEKNDTKTLETLLESGKVYLSIERKKQLILSTDNPTIVRLLCSNMSWASVTDELSRHLTNLAAQDGYQNNKKRKKQKQPESPTTQKLAKQSLC